MIQQRAEHITIAAEETGKPALKAVLQRDERLRPARREFSFMAVDP